MTELTGNMRTMFERAQAGAANEAAPPPVRAAYHALARSYEIEAANLASRRVARAAVTEWEKHERERAKAAECEHCRASTCTGEC